LRNGIGLTILVYEVEILGYVLDVLYGFCDLAGNWHMSDVNSLKGLLDWAEELLGSFTLSLLRFA